MPSPVTMLRSLPCLLLLTALFWVPRVGAAQTRAAPQGGYRDWTVYGGGPEGIRYSALLQINRQNVTRLQVAWRFDSGDEYEGSEMQCNPIVVEGVLYASTPRLRVVALDAATGRLIWSFDPNPGAKPRGKMRSRGLTYWASGEDRRIFVGGSNVLYAIDARMGKLAQSFGNAGSIDLREGLGRDPASLVVGLSSPPALYRDLLIVGSLVSEGLPSAPGDIRAYDVRTGKLRWSFHTIPHPGEYGYETWPKEAWTYSGGANCWAGMALDLKRGLVFAPTGSAAFDFYGANRVGDNLFANSLIALDAATGKRAWHFQVVRHDVWDRDLPSQPSLVTVKHDGRLVDAVAQTTKSGHVFVFDRDTGQPLFPVETRAVVPSDVAGEVLAKTQVLPLKPVPFARQQLSEKDLTTRSEAANKAALDRFRRVRSGPQFTPPSLDGAIVFPGFDGGAEWGGSAFDPETGLLYVNSNEMAWILKLVERPTKQEQMTGRGLYTAHCASCHGADLQGTPPEFPSVAGLERKYNPSEISALILMGSGRMPAQPGLGIQGSRAIARYLLTGEDAPVPAPPRLAPSIDLKYRHIGYIKFLDPEGYPAIQPPWGTLNAINLDTGEFAWRIPFGEFPELAAQGLRNTGTENYGGPVVTAGGLVFIGATNHDRKFHAYDKSTGKLLWETELPAAGNATPAVYEVGGRQFVVIAAGGGKSKHPSGGSYVAFALPEEAKPGW